MECNSLIKNMDLPEAFSCTKYQWKKLVVKKINEKNRNDVLNSIEKSKKLNFEELKAEEFERKPYISTLNIHDARTKFALRSKMTKTIKLNFKNDPKYKKELCHFSLDLSKIFHDSILDLFPNICICIDKFFFQFFLRSAS